MKDFAQDATGDIALDNTTGSIQMVSGKDEIDSKITNALNTNKQELDWNQNIGLDQLDVMSLTNDKQALESILKRYLSRLFGINTIRDLAVHNLNFDKPSRTFSFQANITLAINGRILKLDPTINLGGE